MQGIALEELRKVTYLDLENLQGRTIKLMPLWDGTAWHLWMTTPIGILEGKIQDTTEGDYVANGPAKQSDLFIPFVHLMWQRASWPEIIPLIEGISEDFHNMGTSVAKLKHFFSFRNAIPVGGASRFALTELEYLVTLARTVFDLLQEMISIVWKEKVKLNDASAEAYRHAHQLPRRFSSMVLDSNESPKSADEIEKQYVLPRPLAEQYSKAAQFFLHLRKIRDRVIHGGGGFGHIFETERGFCVNPKIFPFCEFDGWHPEHFYNENIASVLPWVAHTISQTIGTCDRLVQTFASIIQLPPDLAPAHFVFVRGPHNEALVEVVSIRAGGTPWWG